MHEAEWDGGFALVESTQEEGDGREGSRCRRQGLQEGAAQGAATAPSSAP